jgi:hypothetical protein
LAREEETELLHNVLNLKREDIVRPLEPHLFAKWRPTVAALLITPAHGLVLNQKEEGKSFVPPQGGIRNKNKSRPRESVLDALRREMFEEIPRSVLRLASVSPLFRCEHRVPGTERSCWSEKLMYWVAVYIDELPPYEKGMAGHPYVEVISPEQLAQYYRQMSAGKREMVAAAIKMASDRGILSGWSTARTESLLQVA